MKKAPIIFTICTHCDLHISGNDWDLRQHIADEHDAHAWDWTDEDIRDEYRYEELERK